MLSDELMVISVLSRFPYFDEKVANIVIEKYFDNLVKFDDIKQSNIVLIDDNDSMYTVASDVAEIAYPAYCDFDSNKLGSILLTFIASLPANTNSELTAKFRYSMMHLGVLLHTEHAAHTLNQFNVYAHMDMSDQEFDPSLLFIMHAIVEQFLKFKSIGNIDIEIVESCTDFMQTVQKILNSKGIVK